jgi:hypothetical protein
MSHRKRTSIRATVLTRILLIRHVVEPRTRGRPELHVAGGPLRFFANITWRVLAWTVLAVGYSGVDEDHEIGVLLDGAGVAQVGEDGLPLPAPLFRRAREL